MKQKNKLVILALAGVSALMFSTMDTFATDGTVTVETVRMREKPTTSSKVITTLDENDKVNVLEKSDDWYKVAYKNNEGYIYGKYIKVKEEIAEEKEEETPIAQETTGELEQQIEVEETNYTYMAKKESKLYSLPLISSSKIQNIEKDEKIDIIQNLNSWSYVSIDNKIGWLPSNNIETVKEKTNKTEEINNQQTNTDTEKQEDTAPQNENTKTENETKQNTESTIKIGYVNVQSANLRKKPSTNSEAIEGLILNDKLTILGEENDWYKVKYDGTQGYIYKKLVSSEKVKESVSRSSEDRINSNKVVEEPKVEIKEELEIASSQEQDEEEEQSKITGDDIVEYAMKYLGCAYVSGGNGPKVFDCSGFTKYVYKHFGYTIYRRASEQVNNGVEVSRSNLQKGDIIVFLDEGKNKIGHVGLYIGNNKFIHAANPSKGVVTESLSSSYYSPRYVTARRIID